MKREKFYNKKLYHDILTLCDERNWISIYDVVSLFIPNIKYARRTMSKLTQLGWIQTIRCPVLPKKGLGMNFYALTKEGIKRIDCYRKKVNSPKPPNSTNLLHYFVINTFLTGFKVIEKKHREVQVQALSDKQLQIKNRFYNYVAERKDEDDETQIVIPDFAVCLGDGKNKILFLGEVDTCTETIYSPKARVRSIKNKFQSIAGYMENNIYEFFNDIFDYDFQGFSYLHITSGNEQRINDLIFTCEGIVENDFDVYITSLDKILPEFISDSKGRIELSYYALVKPVWNKINVTGNHSIII